ncbi:MAG: hypothetical protein MUO26_03345 [Methanotrichaceae archaeon]|nr:hypothetical protein [Methanotrichaceae archaeon]
MRFDAFWSFVTLLALIGLVQSQQIEDIFSNLESFDITTRGDAAGHDLRVELISEGKVLQTTNLHPDGSGTYISSWRPFEADEGSYDACATLEKNDTAISRKCYGFFYGGRTPLRFDIRDFYADSKGIHLSISANDPTIVDIYYILASGDKAIHVSRERAVPIAGGFAASVKIDYPWKQILENDKEYLGRVKIVELNHNQTRAFQNSFVAMDDAIITETYQDETGASATVLGNSRVPFTGKLQFILMQNGTVLTIEERKTPVLLTGDDETVEISWNNTLNPGIYQLRTMLISNSGDVRDVGESIIEAKPITKPVNTTQAEKKSPMPIEAGFVALIVVIFLMRLKRPGS